MTERTLDDANAVIYLLGFSPRASESFRRQVSAGLQMVECHAVEAIDCWFVRVDRSQFEGPDAEQRLNDVAWLSPRVLAHQTAVEQLATQLPFFPAHFGTLFARLENLAAVVQANRRTLTRFFADEARHIEWGVKCFVNWPAAVAAFQQQGEPAEPNGAAAGLNYLRRKKMIRDRDMQVRDWLQAQLEQLQREAGSLAIRVQQRDTKAIPNEGDWECMANLAVLIPRGQDGALRDWAGKFQPSVQAAARFQVRVTGPWPLYSFLPPLERAA